MVFTQEPVPKHIECKYVTMAANSVAVWVCWNDEIFWWYRLKCWAGNGITVLMNVFLFAPLPPEQKLQLYQINYIFLNVFSNWADLERMKWEKKICWYSFSWIFDGVLTKYFKDKGRLHATSGQYHWCINTKSATILKYSRYCALQLYIVFYLSFIIQN